MISERQIQAVRTEFDRNFQERGEVGASVSIWQRGEEVLTLSGGQVDPRSEVAWNDETLAPVFSATKGVAAAVLLRELEKAGLSPQSKIGEVWSSFPLSEMSFAQMMSHQLGLCALDEAVSVWNHEEVIEALLRQKPAFEPGKNHGYHPRLIGFLWDECSRRLSGEFLGTIWNREIAQSYEIDFWMGLPAEMHDRVAKLIPGRMISGKTEDRFYEAFNTPGTLTRRSFSSPKGLQAIHEMNEAKAWAPGFPAMGGVGSARGLATFYQLLSGREGSPFSPKVAQWASTPQVNGEDQVLLTQSAFTSGFMMDPWDHVGRKVRHLFGASKRAYGHAGAGGSHAFYDPDSEISFAYVMNQMELSVLPGERAKSLVRGLYS